MNMVSFVDRSRCHPLCFTTILCLIAAITLSASNAQAKLLAAGAGTNSVTLTWTAPGDDGDVGTASEYSIRYSTSTINDANWEQATLAIGVPAPSPAGTPETLVVHDLSPGTTYYFAIKSADEASNWSPLSNTVSATTDPEDPPADITDLLATNPSDTSVTLTWTAPGEDGSVGQASEYDIRYSTSVITEANWNSATPVTGEPSPQIAGSAESFTVHGLNQETTYYFAIKTRDAALYWSGLSNVPNSTTVDLTAPETIDDLQAQPGDADGELDISWIAPGDDGSTGTALAYIIKASKELITDDNWDGIQILSDPPTPSESGSLETWTIAGLEPGALYTVAIKTVDNSANLSAMSNVATGEAKVDLGLDIDDEFAELPTEFHLARNYPNPFNPATTIEYAVQIASHVRISVYNVQGQLTATLVDEVKPAGFYTADWTGTDASGTRVASGVYFYRLETADYTKTHKMVLLK